VRAELERRSVLAATVAAVPVLAAGCKGVGALGTPPRAGPEVAVLRSAIRAENVMIARYRSAISRSPGLRATLSPVLSQHKAHLAALRARLIVPAGAPSQPSLSGPAPAGPETPGQPAAVLAALEAAESAAASGLIKRLDLLSPSLAQLLASIAASEASHATLLRTHQGTG
jgi:Ferritin-like domain